VPIIRSDADQRGLAGRCPRGYGDHAARPMTFRFLSRTVRPAFELIVLRLRAAGDKNVEILVLCHQLAVTAPPGRPAPLRCRPGPAWPSRPTATQPKVAHLPGPARRPAAMASPTHRPTLDLSPAEPGPGADFEITKGWHYILA